MFTLDVVDYVTFICLSRFGGLVMLSSQPSWQYFC